MAGDDTQSLNRAGASSLTGEVDFEQLAAALELVNGLFCIYDTQGQVIYMNQAFMDMIGAKAEGLVQLNIVDLAIERHKKGIREKMQARMEVGGIGSWELPIQVPEGKELFVIARTSPWYLGGKIAGEILLMEDITPLKRTEAQLRESERLLADTIESLPDATAVVDREGRILFWNRAMVELTGYPAADMIGKGNHEYTIPFYGFRRPALLDYILDPNTNIDKEYSYIHRDGNVWFIEAKTDKLKGREAYIWARATPIHDTKGDVIGAIEIVRDITDRKREEQELKESHQRLEVIFEGTVNALAVTTEKRDQFTSGHQRRVAALACAIAAKMGLPENTVNDIRVAGTMHDIGQLYVPLDILSKTSRLTDIEMLFVKTHPAAGYDIVKSIPFEGPIAEIILQHQERMDGSGYPRGLKEGEILLEARIMAVADVVEAMVSHRPYRIAPGLEKALEEIEANAGRLYDPAVVEACIKVIQEDNFTFPAIGLVGDRGHL